MGTSKKRFIELHGEEAWKVENEKRKERSRQYYMNNSERLKNKQREYISTHREENKERCHKYYISHKKESVEYYKKYVSTHKERFSEYQKEYTDNHKEKISEYQKEYRKKYLGTKEGTATLKASAYYNQDKRRGRDTSNYDITPSFILEHILNSKCIYCGETDWKKLGCDRIDNTKGHTTDNVVCSCMDCNVDRMYKKISVEDYIKYKNSTQF